MADIAKHIRIFNADPDDDYVSKRITAINSIETVIKKKVGTNEIFAFANGLLAALEQPGQPNDAVNGVSVAALKKSSTAFVADDESLQLLTCTLLATIQYLEKAKEFTQNPSPEIILAIALWNGLSFQLPITDKDRLEFLRKELLQIATKNATDISTTSRERTETKLRVAPITPTESTWNTWLASIDTSYGKLIDAMRINSYLDREEIDILWWVLGGWSNICQVQISTLNAVQRCLVASAEIGKLLRRFPAQAHACLACRDTAQNEEFTGAEVVEQLGDQSANVIGSLNSKEIFAYQKIFPVSNLLFSSVTLPNTGLKRTLNEWAARLLVEISLTNINKFAE